MLIHLIKIQFSKSISCPSFFHSRGAQLDLNPCVMCTLFSHFEPFLQLFDKQCPAITAKPGFYNRPLLLRPTLIKYPQCLLGLQGVFFTLSGVCRRVGRSADTILLLIPCRVQKSLSHPVSNASGTLIQPHNHIFKLSFKQQIFMIFIGVYFFENESLKIVFFL